MRIISLGGCPLAELRTELATDAAGLSSAEALSRLAEFGANLFRDRKERPLWLQFLSRFKNPLVLLLLAARGIAVNAVFIGTAVSIGSARMLVAKTGTRTTIGALCHAIQVIDTK